MDETKKDPLAEAEARVERLAEKVLVPETLAPSAKLNLFGTEVPGRPLTLKYAKRLHQQTRLLWRQISEIVSVRDAPNEERLAVLNKFPDIDQDAANALVSSVLIISEAYKIPGVTMALIEETYTTPQMMKLVGFQLELNEADDFLLQPLRLSLSVMSSIPVLASLMKTRDDGLDAFPSSPSSTVTAKPGA